MVGRLAEFGTSWLEHVKGFPTALCIMTFSGYCLLKALNSLGPEYLTGGGWAFFPIQKSQCGVVL